MTTTALNILGELPTFASLTVCAICHEPYNSGIRRPKLLGCPNGHTLCLQCADRLLNGAGQAKCPTCQQLFVCATGDANNLPTNFELSKAMTEFQDILDRRATGFANCCECRINGDEQGFRLCRECCVAKGPTCDPDSDRFDYEKLESLAVCAGCVLASHYLPGHTIRPFVPFRVRRDRESAGTWACDIAPSVATLLDILKDTPNLILDSNKLVRDMVDVSEYANSSLVLKDMKEFIEQNNKELTKTVKQLNKAVDHFNKEFMHKQRQMLISCEEFRAHCIPPLVQEPLWKQCGTQFVDWFVYGLLILLQLVAAVCRVGWQQASMRIFPTAGYFYSDLSAPTEEQKPVHHETIKKEEPN